LVLGSTVPAFGSKVLEDGQSDQSRPGRPFGKWGLFYLRASSTGEVPPTRGQRGAAGCLTLIRPPFAIGNTSLVRPVWLAPVFFVASAWRSPSPDFVSVGWRRDQALHPTLIEAQPFVSARRVRARTDPARVLETHRFPHTVPLNREMQADAQRSALPVRVGLGGGAEIRECKIL
jgi:hypothetical protein